MPKIRTFDFEVEGTPAEAAARLSRYLSSGDEARVIEGECSADGFELSFARTSRKQPHAVVCGTFSASGPGRTRVVGRCALPMSFVWYFRGTWVVVVSSLGWLVWEVVAEMPALSAPPISWMSLLTLVFSVGFSISIWAADSDVEPLAGAVARAFGIAA